MTILELREKRAKAWDAAKAFLTPTAPTRAPCPPRMTPPTPAWSRISPTWARRSPGWSAAKLWTPS